MPASFIRMAPFCVVKPWNSQYGKPDDGICTPHCVTLPAGVALGQLLRVLDHLLPVAGGLFGIEAGFLERSLFQ